jgi:hypothetical protein
MSDKIHSKSNRGWFAEGRSGNRSGRPVRTRAVQDAVLEILVIPKIMVNGPGGPREMSTAELIEWTTFQAALTGKAMAIRQVTKWKLENKRWLDKYTPKVAAHPVARLITRDPDNADEALQLLGIASPNPERAEIGAAQFLLEPWGVQAALGRRRGGSRLTEGERAEIRRCARDPGNLRWPREISR